MRVALVTETWKPSINGVVTRLSATVDALVAGGHEVLVIAPSLGAGDAAVPRQSGVTLRRIPSFHIGWVYGGQPWGWPLPRVRRLIATFRPDVVHVADPFVLGIAGVRAARRLRVPLITSFHTDIVAYASSYHLAWSRPIIWRILRALHNSARLTLATSQHAADVLTAHGVRDIELWPRGVDLQRFRPRGAGDTPNRGATDTDAEATTAGAGTGGVPTAVYVGRLADEKSIDTLLPLARSATVRLVLVGDGPDRPRLERAFAGTGTVFTGTLTGDTLTRAYADADVFVFPSTTETLGLVLIEALASGLPIVAASSPASRELLHALPVARLVDPATDRAAGRAGGEGFVAAVAGVLQGPVAPRAAQARAAAEGWGWPASTAYAIDRYRQVAAAARTPTAAAVGADVRGPVAERPHDRRGGDDHHGRDVQRGQPLAQQHEPGDTGDDGLQAQQHAEGRGGQPAHGRELQ